MRDDRCDVCGLPAVVSETVLGSDGAVTSRRLCAEHGAIDRDAILSGSRVDAASSLADLATRYEGLSAADKARVEAEYRVSKRRA
jgi:hypothetical protein